MKRTLGEVIAENRRRKGMTQLELAEKMMVTDKAVSKWERGVSCPDISSLPRLSEVLGISIDELMQGKAIEKKPDRKRKEIADAVFWGVGLAMGVAVLVLSILNELDTKRATVMLAIGLVCLAARLLSKDK